jgi:hypothetical protein
MAKPATKKTERKKRESTAPADESKADRFKRVGTPRINKAVKAISVIGNLSGNGYEYTDEQIGKINDALTDAVKVTMAKFVKGGKKDTVKVEL